MSNIEIKYSPSKVYKLPPPTHVVMQSFPILPCTLHMHSDAVCILTVCPSISSMHLATIVLCSEMSVVLH